MELVEWSGQFNKLKQPLCELVIPQQTILNHMESRELLH